MIWENLLNDFDTGYALGAKHGLEWAQGGKFDLVAMASMNTKTKANRTR